MSLTVQRDRRALVHEYIRSSMLRFNEDTAVHAVLQWLAGADGLRGFIFFIDLFSPDGY